MKEKEQKECGMNKSIKGEQEWPPKKVSVKKQSFNDYLNENIMYPQFHILRKP